MSELEQIIPLVESLYSTTDANQVNHIQITLQSLQKSERGLLIANYLLNTDSLNCQFFGALTYAVNINSIKSFDNESQLQPFLDELKTHLFRLMHNSSYQQNAFIIKKLLSNFSLTFLKSSLLWHNPLLSLLSSMFDPSASFPINIDVSDEILLSKFQQLNQEDITLLLMFSQILAEDISRKQTSAEIHHIIQENLYTTTDRLLIFIFEHFHSNQAFMIPALDDFNAWIQYISKAEIESIERFDLTNLITYLLKIIVNDDLIVSQRAIDVAIEILELNPRYFNYEARLLLNQLLFEEGNWGQRYLKYLYSIEDFESINQFSRFVLQYLDVEILKLAKQLIDPSNDYIFQFLLDLTNFPGIPIEEELISKDFIQFWSQLADVYIDDEEVFTVLLNSHVETMVEFEKRKEYLFNRVLMIYWQKIQIPKDEGVYESIREEFRGYRRDASDLFDTAYPIVKLPFLKNLTDNILHNIGKPNDSINFREMESSLYFINTVSANFNENNINIEILNYFVKIFQAEFLAIMIRSDNTYLISTTIEFLSSIDFFYKHKAGLPFLPKILDFLFYCLINSNCKLLTSKAFVRICNDCRVSLIEYLPNFEILLFEAVNAPTVVNLIRERIINSYSSIIQSIKDPNLQADNLNKLLELLINKSKELMGSFSMDQQDYLISLLNCILEAGKGMGLPEDIEDCYSEEEQKTIIEYWNKDPLKIHEKILSLISQFSLDFPQFVNNSEVTEKCCDIFRIGLIEPLNGAFVLSVTDVVSYLCVKIDKCDINAIPFLYNCFSLVITTNFRSLPDDIYPTTINRLFLSKLDLVKSDPDLVESSITIFETILDKKPGALIYHAFFQETILRFCLEGLISNEKFILRSTSRFWTHFLNLKKGTQNDKIFVNDLMNKENLGLFLTSNLAQGLLKSQRSCLDIYVDVFRVLVAQYPLKLKSWLRLAFEQLNETRDNKLQNTELFINKLMLTRGMRKASDVIRDYWLECNNLINYSKKA